jgi:hypothetical protein
VITPDVAPKNTPVRVPLFLSSLFNRTTPLLVTFSNDREATRR